MDFLFNKNGKLEGQRINEQWFIKNGYSKEWEFFSLNKIVDAKSYYDVLNPDQSLCSCGKEKRFVGFREGYKQHCEKCARTKNNCMKTTGDADVEINDIVNFVKVNGKYSTARIKKLSNNTIRKIVKRTEYIKDASISERIYHIEHNLKKLPICKVCGKEHNNFYSSINGYRLACKGECSYIIGNNTSKNKKSIAQKRIAYNNFLQKYKSNDEYDITLFSFSDYLKNKTTIRFVHKKCGHKYDYDISYQGHTKCPKCYPIRSKKQYEIYEFVGGIFNDRQLIKPKELDIVNHEIKMAIEYDSLMFHSYGFSTVDHFNNLHDDENCHLYKTELVEQNGYQLFRIFSNEWINKTNIWKSVLNNKMGFSNKIYARKCVVKEINSKECSDFLENNHLQGKIKSSIRLGLFFNGELVSVMTFGKARRTKWKGEDNFELYRFCSKLNTNVVGGASKLLKYFERKYNPNLIISYANRRWSQGNLYEKLGFDFVENSQPNYFYFKGGDSSVLLSREQFQKHKLKNKLEKFDPLLTETQNMYNNGYRKIFDCGNKIYIKTY